MSRFSSRLETALSQLQAAVASIDEAIAIASGESRSFDAAPLTAARDDIGASREAVRKAVLEEELAALQAEAADVDARVVETRQAIKDAQATIDTREPQRVGTVVGVAVGG